MYILLDKDNVIIEISETLNRQEETNYYLVNNDTLAIPDTFVNKVYGKLDVPEGVVPARYCYDGKEFTKNENYVEHYSEEDRISALEDMVNMLLLGGLDDER